MKKIVLMLSVLGLFATVSSANSVQSDLTTKNKIEKKDFTSVDSWKPRWGYFPY